MKKSFDLWRMQIHRNYMVDTDRLQQIGNHARGDWFSTALPLVCARIAKIGDYSGDAPGGRTPARIGQSQQLDQVVIDRW